jgi:hypothetical protein
MLPALPDTRRAWTPESYAELSLWLDASALATLTLASGAVAAWADRSPANHGLAQGTSGARPAWSAAAGGTSLPGVTFDGTDDHLRLDEAWMYAAGSCTVLAVVTSASPATTRALITEGSTASATPTYGPLRTQGATASTAVSLITTDAASNVLGNSPTGTSSFASTPQLLVRHDSGTNMRARRNGALGNNTAYTRATTTLNTFCLGARAKATPDAFFIGTVHEVVAVSPCLASDSAIELFEGYLAWKWGVALPSGHEYAGATP